MLFILNEHVLENRNSEADATLLKLHSGMGVLV